jgi:hypothetical protein
VSDGAVHPLDLYAETATALEQQQVDQRHADADV